MTHKQIAIGIMLQALAVVLITKHGIGYLICLYGLLVYIIREK